MMGRIDAEGRELTIAQRMLRDMHGFGMITFRAAKLHWVPRISNHNLGANLDHAIRRDAEVGGRIFCRSCEPYEELLLPERHL
jgi:hypothetical protein